MKIETSKLFSDVLIFSPIIFEDDRGFFFESFNNKISETLNVNFPQENHSVSKKNVFRGLHYQWDQPTGKLCRCVRGTVIDYFVDIRKNSPTFGKYDTVILSDKNYNSVWIPPGFAHGFLTLTDDCNFLYKCTAVWNKYGEGSIDPFDSDLGIYYPILQDEMILSEKDKNSISITEYLKDPKF